MRKRIWTPFIVDLLLVLVISGHTSTAVAQAQGTFMPTDTMRNARYGHTATLLLNGKVFITGGVGSGSGNSTELYDPSSGRFTATANMTTIRFNPSATLLPDGRVLIAGGDKLGTAELYDPANGTFTATGNMVATQYWHTATLLNNGKVLIAGGGRDCPNQNDGCLIVERPELYDPSTATFTVTGDYADKSGDPWFETAGLVSAPATLLPNGKVLIAAEPTAELYDPGTGTFELTGQMTRGKMDRQPGWGIGGTATLLKNGKVLLAGGQIFETSYLLDAELYDPTTGKFTAVGSMLKARDGHTATLLSDGTVLIAGGQGWDTINGLCCYATGSRADAEVYDPLSGVFQSTSSMIGRRLWPAATLLTDGKVLMSGGWDRAGAVDTAELYVPSVLVPAPVVTNIQFDRTTVVAGTSYSVNVSVANITAQTFFDVRFIAPGSKTSDVVLNWQRGVTASHGVPAGIASGIWTINGVRPHQIETDHTGNFIPVSATITVSP